MHNTPVVEGHVTVPDVVETPTEDAVEAARLSAVERYDVLDTPPDGHFDRITRLAAQIFDVPISIVSIVYVDRVWFKSHHGIDATECPRGPGLCASAILDDSVWVANDAATDPRTLTNPLVAGDLGLRFYAGAPLITHDGFRLGTLCIIDRHPRGLNPDESAMLADLSALVVSELELRLAARTVQAQQLVAQVRVEQLALTDHLTGVPNRRAFELILAEEEDRARSVGRDVALAMIDIDGLKLLNDQEGHERGDAFLQTFARAFRSSDVLYRIGGDEFTIVLPVTGTEAVEAIQHRIDSAVEHTRAAGFPTMGASVGIALLSEGGWSAAAALSLADTRMYASKANAVNSGAIDGRDGTVGFPV